MIISMPQHPKLAHLFIIAAYALKMRVDLLTLHRYDEGNQTNKSANDILTSIAILNKFKNHLKKLTH